MRPIRITEETVRWALPRVMAVVVACTLPFVSYSLVARVTASRMFLVASVTVHGATATPEAELLAAADLGRARNILTLDAAEVRRGLESHPWVRSADVDVDFRDRSVTISVEQRVLAGIAVSDAPMLVDTYGEPIRRWEPTDGLDVPTLVPASREAAPVDLRRLLDVAAMVSATERGAAVGVAEVQDREVLGYRVVLADGFEVRVARTDTEHRVRRLDAALRAAPAAPRPTYALADGTDPDRIVIGTRPNMPTQEMQR